jgi:hypothetical protein
MVSLFASSKSGRGLAYCVLFQLTVLFSKTTDRRTASIMTKPANTTTDEQNQYALVVSNAVSIASEQHTAVVLALVPRNGSDA